MRTHIAKALQSRCKAIRNAVNTYNEAARQMSPAKPTLDWSRVSHYQFLEEFEILRGTRQDISEQPWATTLARQILKQDLRIKRAREEIIRCNVEIARVHTAIMDEHDLFDKCLRELEATNDPLRGVVSDFVLLRKRVNYNILARFEKTYQLKGFSGVKVRGVRKGGNISEGLVLSGPHNPMQREAILAQKEDDDESQPEDAGDADAEQVADVIALVDYISDLPRQNPRD